MICWLMIFLFLQRMKFSLIRQFRTAAQDYDLHVPGINPDNRIHLKKGQMLSVSSYCIHHDPSLFHSPFEFRPERFLNGEVVEGSFMPFGTGPRICIAMRFAKVVLRYVLMNVIKEFKVKVTSNTDIPIKYGRMSFVMDFEGMILHFEPRNRNKE